MERAFRQDMDVWSGPSSVVFPRRYHSLMQLKSHQGTAAASNSNKRKDAKKSGNNNSNSNNNNNVYYGSQSQGWMYGDGLARLGGLSWMDVTSPPAAASSTSTTTSSNSKRKKKTVDKTNKPTTTTTNQPKSSSGFLIDDVTIIDKSLSNTNLTRSHLTPRAYACLLEQARRYTLELLADAQDYALHAQRGGGSDSTTTIAAKKLLPADLLLAVEMRGDRNGVSSTLPRVEEVQCVAEEVNRIPLPAIPRDCYGGVVLPPVEEQLTARTFDVVNGARVAQKMMRGGDYPMGLSDVGNLGKKGGGGGGSSGGGSRKVGSYGAGVGRQIVVNLKSGKGGGEKEVKKGSGGGGAKASASAAGKTSSSSASGSGSKGQKRKLTEL